MFDRIVITAANEAQAKGYRAQTRGDRRVVVIADPGNNVISFSGITNTMKAGTKPQMQAERKYFDNLTNGHSFEITKEGLKIFFDESGILEFKVKEESDSTPL